MQRTFAIFRIAKLRASVGKIINSRMRQTFLFPKLLICKDSAIRITRHHTF